MAWTILLIAGLFEVAWTLGLKATEGFTRPVPSLLTVAAMALSMWLLGVAAKTLPIGTAYAVWVGIGVLGASVGGVLFYSEPLSTLRVIFLVVIAVGIVGLKLTA